MISFDQLYGVPKTQIQKVCVLTPFMSKGLTQFLNIQKLNRGSPFTTGQSENFTLIHTQVGAPFVGDALLYLEDSPCEYLIFLGACGAVNQDSHLTLGSVVAPHTCLNYESFSQLVNHTVQPQESHPSEELMAIIKTQTVDTIKCASFGSFKLEEEYLDELRQEKVDGVEMEISAFFNAAKYVNRKSLALCYVTDILNESHVFEPMSPARQSVIEIAQQRSYQIVREIAERLSET